jgi:hypothetical protein
VRAIEDRLIALRKAFNETDFAMVGICSNDARRYPDDSAEKLKERSLLKSYSFPYVLDTDQTVAKAFDAVCTPDLYLFDKDRMLFYHGQLDDNWQNEKLVKKQDLKDAITAILLGQSPPSDQKPSLGCSIKWQ